jgi:hypothetical protein
MRKNIVNIVGIAVALSFAWSGVALGQKKVDLKRTPTLTNALKGKTVKKRGSFKKLKGVKAEVRKGVFQSLPKLAAQAFSTQRAFQSKARAGDRSLYGKPVVTNHAVTTDDYLIMTERTDYVVKNPAAFKKKFPTLPVVTGGSTVKASNVDLAGLRKTKAGRTFLADEVTAVKKLSKRHPLRIAYDKNGDKGLLAAFSNGIGPMFISSTVLVPLKAPKVIKGTIKTPVITPKGIKIKSVKVDSQRKLRVKKRAVKPFKAYDVAAGNKVALKGKYTEVDMPNALGEEFMAGKTIGFSKSKCTTIGSKLWAEFCYEIGFDSAIRVPIPITWKLSPALAYTKSRSNSGRDRDTDVSLTVTAKAEEKATSFYTDAGVKSSKRYSGAEFYFDPFANVSVQIGAGKAKGKKRTIGIQKGDKVLKKEIRPEWQNSLAIKKDGRWEEPTFLVPQMPQLTVGVNVAVASGEAYAQPGVELGGSNSTIKIDSQLYIDDTASGGRKTLTFRPNDQSEAHDATIPAIPSYPSSTGKKHVYYKYKLSNPRYATTITATPGVRLTVEYKWVWSKKTHKHQLRIFPNSWEIDLFRGQLGAYSEATNKLEAVGLKAYKK